MANSKLVDTYCAISIRLVQVSRHSAWLQWQRYEIKYSIPVTTLVDAIAKTRRMIDTVLALEACYELPKMNQAKSVRNLQQQGEKQRQAVLVHS